MKTVIASFLLMLCTTAAAASTPKAAAAAAAAVDTTSLNSIVKRIEDLEILIGDLVVTNKEQDETITDLESIIEEQVDTITTLQNVRKLGSTGCEFDYDNGYCVIDKDITIEEKLYVDDDLSVYGDDCGDTNCIIFYENTIFQHGTVRFWDDVDFDDDVTFYKDVHVQGPRRKRKSSRSSYEDGPTEFTVEDYVDVKLEQDVPLKVDSDAVFNQRTEIDGKLFVAGDLNLGGRFRRDY